MVESRQPPRTLQYPPDNGPILNWFAGRFDSVFVIFNPFVRMPLPLSKYPSVEEILRLGRGLAWRDVAQKTGLRYPHQVNTALLSAIAALRRQLLDSAAADKLSTFHERHNVWFPAEGHF